MRIDLNEVYERAYPWDLTIGLCGRDFKARDLSNLEVVELRRALNAKVSEEAMQTAATLVSEAFEEPRPAVEWLREDDSRMAMLATSLLTYAAVEISKKKLDATPAAVAAAVLAATKGTTGK